MGSLDWSQCPDVESIPGKVSGAWVLKGTRMPVSAIFENLEAGANLDDIMEWFDGLDREQVKAVIEFAARSLDKEPAYGPLDADSFRSGNASADPSVSGGAHGPHSSTARLGGMRIRLSRPILRRRAGLVTPHRERLHTWLN